MDSDDVSVLVDIGSSFNDIFIFRIWSGIWVGANSNSDIDISDMDSGTGVIVDSDGAIGVWNRLSICQRGKEGRDCNSREFHSLISGCEKTVFKGLETDRKEPKKQRQKQSRISRQ